DRRLAVERDGDAAVARGALGGEAARLGGARAADRDLPDARVAIGVGAAGHLDGDLVAEVRAADRIGPRGREYDQVAVVELGAHLGGGGVPIGGGRGARAQHRLRALDGGEQRQRRGQAVDQAARPRRRGRILDDFEVFAAHVWPLTAPCLSRTRRYSE